MRSDRRGSESGMRRKSIKYSESVLAMLGRGDSATGMTVFLFFFTAGAVVVEVAAVREGGEAGRGEIGVGASKVSWVGTRDSSVSRVGVGGSGGDASRVFGEVVGEVVRSEWGGSERTSLGAVNSTRGEGEDSWVEKGGSARGPMGGRDAAWKEEAVVDDSHARGGVAL